MVGHSWSASLVLAYALEYSDEISGIVLLAPGAYGGKAYPVGSIDRLLYHMVKIPVIGSLFLSTLFPLLGRRMVKPMLEATFSPDPVPPDYLQLAAALFPRPTQLKANREDVHTFSPTVETLKHRYAEIRVPVVIVVGDSDPFNPEQQAYRLHEAIPDSKLIILHNTGHMIPQVRPEAVLDAVRIVHEQIRKSERHVGA